MLTLAAERGGGKITWSRIVPALFVMAWIGGCASSESPPGRRVWMFERQIAEGSGGAGIFYYAEDKRECERYRRSIPPTGTSPEVLFTECSPALMIVGGTQPALELGRPGQAMGYILPSTSVPIPCEHPAFAETWRGIIRCSSVTVRPLRE
jgi:hypothetical protein